MIARRACDTSCDTGDTVPSCRHAADSRDSSHSRRNNLACGDVGREQLLIFTKGSQTYTPHQIGIKRMPCSAAELMFKQHAHEADRETQDFGQNDEDADDDVVDVSVELHGHIIGMNLSPDHRLVSLSLSLMSVVLNEALAKLKPSVVASWPSVVASWPIVDALLLLTL